MLIGTVVACLVGMTLWLLTGQSMYLLIGGMGTAVGLVLGAATDSAAQEHEDTSSESTALCAPADDDKSRTARRVTASAQRDGTQKGFRASDKQKGPTPEERGD